MNNNNNNNNNNNDNNNSNNNNNNNNKLKKHKSVCNDHDYCGIEMPNEYNKILKNNHGEKSL